jgi:hypothetical protein
MEINDLREFGRLVFKDKTFATRERKEHKDKRLCQLLCFLLRSLCSFAAIRLWRRLLALFSMTQFSRFYFFQGGIRRY